MSSNPKQYEEIIELTFQVGRLLRGQKERFSEHAKIHETVSPYHIMSLNALMQGASTMGDVAHEMNISFSTATSLVDRLVKGGWVERGFDPDDRRIIRLSLTKAGRELITKHKEEHYKSFNFVLDMMPPEDISDMQRILSHLKQSLENVSQTKGRK